MCEFVSSNSVFFGGIPSGHFVCARPRNLSVTALIFAAFEILRIRDPRSMAVLLFEERSPASNPCRKRNGSAMATDTLTPFPDAMGRSAGADLFEYCELEVVVCDKAPFEYVDMESLLEEVSLNCGRAFGFPTAVAMPTGACIECLNPARMLLSVSCGSLTSESAVSLLRKLLLFASAHNPPVGLLLTLLPSRGPPAAQDVGLGLLAVDGVVCARSGSDGGGMVTSVPGAGRGDWSWERTCLSSFWTVSLGTASFPNTSFSASIDTVRPFLRPLRSP